MESDYWEKNPGKENMLSFLRSNPSPEMEDRPRRWEFKATGVEAAHGMALIF